MTLPSSSADPASKSQRGRLGFLAKDSAIYGIGAALNKILALFTFPLLARSFSVAEFGTIDLLNTWILLVVVLFVFGQDSSVVRYYYEYDDKRTRQQVISQSFVFQMGIMLLAVPVIWSLAGPIGGLAGLGTGDDAGLIRLMIAQIPFFIFINFSQAILKFSFQRTKFLIVSVGSALVTLLGLGIALAFFNLSIHGVFVVYLVTRAMFGLLGLWFVRGWLTIPRGWKHLSPLLRFAAPFGVICIIVAVLPVLERTLVGTMLGGDALGFFAAGAKVAMLINLPINALETSWGPFSLALHREADAAPTFNLVLQIVCVLLFGSVLAISAAADLIVALLGSSRYEGAGIVTFALCMGLALQAIGSITGVGILFSKRSHLKLVSYFSLLLVASIAIPLLAHFYGIAGAAWGSMLGMLAMTGIETGLAQRAWPLAWRFRGPVLLTFFTLGAGLLHQLTFGTLAIAGINLVPLLAMLLLVPLAWFVLLSDDERRRAVAMARERLA